MVMMMVMMRHDDEIHPSHHITFIVFGRVRYLEVAKLGL